MQNKFCCRRPHFTKSLKVRIQAIGSKNTIMKTEGMSEQVDILSQIGAQSISYDIHKYYPVPIIWIQVKLPRVKYFLLYFFFVLFIGQFKIPCDPKPNFLTDDYKMLKLGRKKYCFSNIVSYDFKCTTLLKLI